LSEDLIPLIGVLALGYISGSIPNAVVIARMYGVQDIRRTGTGNPGAANVFRQVSPMAGLLVGLADILKGAVPVAVAVQLLDLGPAEGAMTGAAAVIGHQFSVFLWFRGGAGLATTVGAIAMLLPVPFALAAGFGAVLALTTRNMGWSAGSVLVLTFFFALLFSLDIAISAFPAAEATSDPAFILSGFSLSLLLLFHFWTRLGVEWWRRRAVQTSSGSPATEGPKSIA
jgi:glycerol-3-phosphate acyltransferase PlsY